VSAPVTSSSTAPPKGRRSRLQVLTFSDKIWLKFAIGIPVAIHVIFVWIPAFLTGILSFMKWDNLRPPGSAEGVGFRNYWQIFTIFDTKLFPALFNNLVLIIWLALCSTVGMLFAYLLDKNIRGGRFYQSVFYMPVVLSVAVVGFIWKAVMFHPDQGLLNLLIPGKGIDFVGDQSYIFQLSVPFLDFPLGVTKNFAALLLAMAWRHIGYVMVLYLAGLKSVDPSLKEAAAIDGANEVKSFRHVVFPTLKPINVVVAVITVIEALRAYDIVAALNEPRGTEVMGTLVVGSLSGEGGGRVGLGSAYGMVLFLLCIGFIIYYVINNFRESN
jgi:multiple sugar transport system permease protein